MLVSLLGVVSASQDPAMNNMTLTSSSGDAAFESLSGGSIDENLQAGNGELLSAKTHVVSGSSVDDIKNLFDSGTVQGGDTVYLANRTFSSDWQEWMNPINVNVGNIVITGANTSNPNEFSTINANQAKVFSLNAAGITLTNIKFVNSQGGGPGSAVNIQASDCTINNCAFNNCQSPNGGAIGSSASASNVKITNCNFTNNVAKWSGSGGAVYLAGSGNEINGCNFDGNTAGKYGAVFSAGTIEVKNSNFTNNNAGNDNGGALYIQGANSVVDNCNFIGNEVTAGHLYGGAVALYGSASSISSSNFERNKAGSGGAVLIQASNIDIDNCNFTSNSATSSGGAIYIANNFHNASMSYCNFEDNAAASGKAIFAAGSSSGKVSNCDLGGVTDLAVTAGYPELIFTLSTDYSNIVVGNIEGASGEGSKVPVPDEEIRLEIRDSNGVLKVNVTNKTNNQGQVTYDYSNLPKGTYTYTAYYMNGKSKTGTFGIIQVEGDKFSNIQSTIDSASSGAIIFLKNIIYTNDIDGNMVIDKPISIIGVDGTVLDAEGKSRIFNINDNVNNVVLDNIEFINGISKENGGAINIGSNCANVNILNSNFTNNRVFDASQQNWPEELGHGGAIAISGSAHNGVIANSTFINNTVPVGGGAIKNFGGQGWKIDNSTFINNTAQGIFTNNPSQVPNGGGALWSCMAQMAIINSTFIENEAPYGGGIRGFVDTYDCEFYFNVATNGNGGGIDVTIDGRVQRPRLEFVNTTFVNNTAKGKRSDDRAQGGALHMYHIEHVDMIDCKCYNNTADRGGAIDLYIIGTVIVANSDIENNTAYSEGGGFYINTTSSPSEFLNSNVTNNKAGTDGGAIYLITDGAFFDNIISVNNTASRGGSAFIRGHDAIIQHSTFNNNSAINNGTENSGIGGAFDILGNNCQLINVTSKYNNATLGGSTFIRGDHTKIRDSTFDYNNATLRGGGINVAGSDCNVTNVDVSGNFAGTDGGAVYVKGNHASFVDVGSYNNTACRGGSTFIEGDFVDVHNCTLDNNKALFNGSNVSGRGGGLDIAGENCQIYDLDVSNNTAEREGGAFYVKSSNIHFYDIQSMNNTAQRGGSSYIRGNNITVSNSTFDNNRAVNNGSDETGLGGALDILGNDCKFINVESLNNNATLGGSTFIRGNNTLIKNCTLDNNYASERGGGLDIAGNNCTVIDVDLSNNRAKNDGGAVYVRGNNATFEEVDSLNNTAARGGSSFVDGNNTRITNCDLDNNTATIRGGGLDVAGVNCTVINVTLSNCNATEDGGAVYVRGNNVLFDNVTSKNNIAQRGGSSFIQGNNITVQNCHLDNNKAIANGTNSSTGRAGGLDIAGDGCTIVNVTLSNNYGDNDGGAVYVKGNNALFDNVTSINNIAKRGGSSFIEGNNITVKNSHLDNNNASVRGGGLDVAGDNCTFENVTLSNCHADEDGGAVYVRGNNNLFEGVTSVSNTASSGGSSCIVGNNATVKNCTLNKNSASFAGGAISITGDECKFYNNNISYNDAMFGGSIYVEGTNALFDNNNISYNEAYMGGAIAIESGENSKFTNNNITFNYASDAGGAVFVDGPNSNFTHNNISSNRAEENGGGILSYGENLYLEDIYGFNNTAQNGGFAAIMMADNMVVKNSTFISNHALGDISVGRGEGGAFHISGSQNANIQANFQHNTAVNGSAIYVDDYNGLMPSSVYIHDSLFYDNQAKSYLLIIDVDTLGSAANGTVPGVCECKCNCTASNSHATATNKNNVLTAMFENSSNHKAIKLMNILRANNVNCTCGCGCSGNCNVGSSCNCSCSKSKYIPTVFTGEGIKLIVYHMGGDNIANAIYNSNCGVVVNNISYPFYDINGNETVKRTLETDVTPVIGPENSRDGKDIYQYPFENNQVIRIIVLNETGDVVKDVTYGDINKTDIYGKTSLALNDLKKGSYTVKAIYKESTYYTAIENNAVFRVIPPTMVSKLTINETVNFGDNVQFEIIVNNTNNFTLHNVSITEIYNETELRFVNYTNQNLWNKNGNVFTYKGNLNANEVAKFTIIFKTLVYGNLNNMVSLKTNETGDQVFTANNKTTVNGSPNMTVKKVCLNVSDFVVVNDVVVFNVTVTNVGDCTLGNVNVSEQFDAGEFKFIRFIGENWSTKDNITFVYGNGLVKGGNATFTVYFKALTNGTLVNNVTARSNMAGDVNGTDKVTVYSPDMSVSKLTLNNTVRVDDQVVFTVVVTNTGDCDLGNISVVEQIPDGLAYKTFDGAGWSKVDDYVFNY
ncbi:right-handed parallel beta-helix repeat-containing protein, partial [uncultured Methanobrevibacter sp.]|uniref:beta strand repeat-containing protein n=1 Tax=uncultured Methanobrevibacter sp. TaxID=253161 RepID=UPI0032099414